jgi:hypothetical protein
MALERVELRSRWKTATSSDAWNDDEEIYRLLSFFL